MVLDTEFARHVVLETKISPSESEKGSLQSHSFSVLCVWSSNRNCVPGKGLPGCTTLHAKFKVPISDCNSLRVQDFLLLKEARDAWIRSTLSRVAWPPSCLNQGLCP